MTNMQASLGEGSLLPNRAQLQDLIGSMGVTQLIYVAATLGIADRLKEGSKRIDELASTAAADTTALYRVLPALASRGIFAETGDCSFALTPQAALLRDDVPGSLRAWAMMQGEESRWKPWGALLECVQTGETAFNQVFGMGWREYLAAHPDAAETFNRMSASNTDGRAMPIVEAYDFSAATTVIDLGGGRGGLMTAILSKHPTVKGVLTDLPAVVQEAKAFLDTQGLSARCAVVSSDLLVSVPQGGDIYVMKSVLHGLNDEKTVTVLKNCRAAMAASAKLLVIEAVLPPHGSPSPLITMLDVQRMVINGGRERSQEGSRPFWKPQASAYIVSSRREHKTRYSKHSRSSQGARYAQWIPIKGDDHASTPGERRRSVLHRTGHWYARGLCAWGVDGSPRLRAVTTGHSHSECSTSQTPCPSLLHHLYGEDS